MIIVQNENEIPQNKTAKGHELFIAWLNTELDNRTAGFWYQFVDYLYMSLFSDVSKIFITELYAENGKDFAGFIVYSNYDATNKVLLFFDANGLPVAYSTDSNVNSLLVFTDYFEVSEFQAEMSIPIYDGSNTQIGDAVILLETFFGCNFPFLLFRDMSAVVQSKALIDVVYETRLSSSYFCYIEPNTDVPKFAVKNVSRLKIEIDVPFFNDYHQRYSLNPNDTVYVPVTDLSSYYLRSLEKLGNIRLRKP